MMTQIEKSGLSEKVSPDFLLSLAKKSGILCFDIEHEPNLSWHKKGFRIHGCGFSSLDGNSIVREYFTDYEIISEFVKLFPNVELVAHNAKYDLHCLRASGFNISDCEVRDTMVVYNLLDENIKDLGLKKLVQSLYGHTMQTFEEASKFGLNSPQFREYALEDVFWELKLYLDAVPKLKNSGLWKLFDKILTPVLYVFFEMEHYGVNWDMKIMKNLYFLLFSLRKKLEQDIYSSLGKFNINSANQLAKVLFQDKGYSTQGLRYLEKTEKFSVDSGSLEILAKRYPICEKILGYRTCNKIISTYLEPLSTSVVENFDNRVHCVYWLTSTTGRVRCSDPNLQNIPVNLGKSIIHNQELRQKLEEVKIRSGFTAPPGKKLVVADFSQIELRVGAVVSNEPELMDAYLSWSCCCGAKGKSRKLLRACPSCGLLEDEKAYREGKGFWHGLDLHTMVLNHVPEKLRKRLNRSHGKHLNFLVLYGGGPRRLNQEYPELSVDECQDIINSIMASRKKIRDWHNNTKKALYNLGSVVDFFGRRRKIPKSEIRKWPRHALNQLVNFQVQSPACSLTLIAMVKFHKRIKELGLQDKVKLILMVHDELVVESDEDFAEIAAKELVESMESINIGIPIRAECSIVNSWAEG